MYEHRLATIDVQAHNRPKPSIFAIAAAETAEQRFEHSCMSDMLVPVVLVTE
jgi:hypothetical protein